MEKFLAMIGPRKVPNCYTRILCACSILEGAGYGWGFRGRRLRHACVQTHFLERTRSEGIPDTIRFDLCVTSLVLPSFMFSFFPL